MKRTTKTLRLAGTGIAALALATGAPAQDRPQISGDLHIRITDGKGNSREYDLSESAPLPVDLMPWVDQLESGDALDEIAQFAEQAMNAWADDLMRRLRERCGETKPWLGVAVQPLPEDVAAQLPQLKGAGLIVRDTKPGSPAALAGLLPNDVLTRLNDQILFSEQQLTGLIATFAPGEEVSLTWMRGAKQMNAKATLAAAHAPTPAPALGKEARAYLDEVFGSGSASLLEMAAANPEISTLSIFRRIVRIDEQGNIQLGEDTKIQAGAEIRKHLQAHAPDLVAGFDGILLELGTEPDPVASVKRLGEMLEDASPELRHRILKLVGEMAEDLGREIQQK